MIYIQRKLKCKYTGDEKYRQEGIERDKWMPVVGFESRKRNVTYEGKTKVVDDLYYVVISAKSEVLIVSSINCIARIDEGAELQGGQAVGLMNNILSVLKVISEGYAKNNTSGSSSGGDSNGGETA